MSEKNTKGSIGVLNIIVLVLILVILGAIAFIFVSDKRGNRQATDETKTESDIAETGNQSQSEDQMETESDATQSTVADSIQNETSKTKRRIQVAQTEEEAEIEGALSSDNEGQEYIFFNSDSEYLTKDEVEEKSDQELKLARNEIYARHGRMFNSEELTEYFESKSWYTPTYSPEEFDSFGEDVLNKYEQANKDLIVEVEKERSDKK